MIVRSNTRLPTCPELGCHRPAAGTLREWSGGESGPRTNCTPHLPLPSSSPAPAASACPAWPGSRTQPSFVVGVSTGPTYADPPIRVPPAPCLWPPAKVPNTCKDRDIKSKRERGGDPELNTTFLCGRTARNYPNIDHSPPPRLEPATFLTTSVSTLASCRRQESSRS